MCSGGGGGETWCPLQCLWATTVGVLSPGVCSGGGGGRLGAHFSVFGRQLLVHCLQVCVVEGGGGETWCPLQCLWATTVGALSPGVCSGGGGGEGGGGLVPTSVFSGHNCWHTVSRCGQV